MTEVNSANETGNSEKVKILQEFHQQPTGLRENKIVHLLAMYETGV